MTWYQLETYIEDKKKKMGSQDDFMKAFTCFFLKPQFVQRLGRNDNI